MKSLLAEAARRVRIMHAACFQSWHQHRCTKCPETWFCCASVCAQEKEPVTDMCLECEIRETSEWARAYSARRGVRL
jgi:hypothetical protein